MSDPVNAAVSDSTKNRAISDRPAPHWLTGTGLDAEPTPFSSIPVIDISPLFAADENARKKVGDTIRQACMDIGFFYVTGHCVNADILRAAFDSTQRFFDLPLQQKEAVSINHSSVMRGYTGLLQENTDPANHGDMHEAFDASLDLDPDDPDVALGIYGYGVNQWPDTLENFREPVMRYHTAMLELSEALYRAFALALALPENYFATKITKPVAELRLLHYPSQHGAIDERVIGIGAHSDYDSFTILATDDVPALQVLNSAGNWIQAPPVEGAFIVNVGDLLARWSNDIFKSTVHRAINRSGKRRYSMPFFMSTNPAELIEVLPSCQSADRPAKYKPVAAGRYIQMCMEEAYESHD